MAHPVLAMFISAPIVANPIIAALTIAAPTISFLIDGALMIGALMYSIIGWKSFDLRYPLGEVSMEVRLGVRGEIGIATKKGTVFGDITEERITVRWKDVTHTVFDGVLDVDDIFETEIIKRLHVVIGLGERPSGEGPLGEGKTRVRWRCGCGRNMYDDFTEIKPGAAAELQKWLNDSMINHTGLGASTSSQNATLRLTGPSSSANAGHRQPAESDISLQSLAPSGGTLPGSNNNAAIAVEIRSEKCWLLLCGKSKRGPDSLLTQLNLYSTSSDKELFHEMKSSYSNLRNHWALRPFLRGVKTIRFVQVSLSYMIDFLRPS